MQLPAATARVRFLYVALLLISFLALLDIATATAGKSTADKSVGATTSAPDSSPADDKAFLRPGTVEGLDFKMSLGVKPRWQIFTDFNDASQTISGKLLIKVNWEVKAEHFLDNPAGIVEVMNFVSGDSGRQNIEPIVLKSPDVADYRSSSVLFSGAFDQRGFDMSCFPFDTKTVEFKVVLLHPGGKVFDIQLMCHEDDGDQEEVNDNGEVLKCSTPVGTAANNFLWESFVCVKVNPTTVSCHLHGIRDPTGPLKFYLFPSMLFSAMGFCSFKLGAAMYMPRIATTMISLLSLSNLRNSLIAKLPSTGSMAWMEEYFLLSMIFMFLNLTGHMLVFYFARVEKVFLARLVDHVNFFGFGSFFLLLNVVELQRRQCEQVADWLILLCLVVAILLVLASGTLAAARYRNEIHQFRRRNIHLPTIRLDSAPAAARVGKLPQADENDDEEETTGLAPGTSNAEMSSPAQEKDSICTTSV